MTPPPQELTAVIVDPNDSFESQDDTALFSDDDILDSEDSVPDPPEDQPVLDSADDAPLNPYLLENSMRGLLFGGPLSRKDSCTVLSQALMLIKKPKVARSSMRLASQFDDEAKKLARFITGDAKLGSSTNSSQKGSPKKKHKTDEYCGPIKQSPRGRVTTLATKKKIVELVDLKSAHKVS